MKNFNLFGVDYSWFAFASWLEFHCICIRYGCHNFFIHFHFCSMKLFSWANIWEWTFASITEIGYCVCTGDEWKLTKSRYDNKSNNKMIEKRRTSKKWNKIQKADSKESNREKTVTKKHKEKKTNEEKCDKRFEIINEDKINKMQRAKWNWIVAQWRKLSNHFSQWKWWRQRTWTSEHANIETSSMWSLSILRKNDKMAMRRMPNILTWISIKCCNWCLKLILLFLSLPYFIIRLVVRSFVFHYSSLLRNSMDVKFAFGIFRHR